MIRRPGTVTSPLTTNLPHPSRERSNDFLGRIHRNLLTGAHSGDSRRGIPTEARSAGGAALHLRGAGTLAARRGASAVGRPAAVSGGAGGLGAALYVGGVGRAGAGNGGAAGRCAGCFGDADAWCTVGAVTRLVGGSEGGSGEEKEDGELREAHCYGCDRGWFVYGCVWSDAEGEVWACPAALYSICVLVFLNRSVTIVIISHPSLRGNYTGFVLIIVV